MHANFECDGDVVLVTGAVGALGSAVCRAFADAGATVCGTDVVAPAESDDAVPTPTFASFYQGDLTEDTQAAHVVSSTVADHGGLDALCNVAGMWQGGDPIHETPVSAFETVLDVNLKTMFLASAHAIPHLQESGGTIVSVSARASLEGGQGDGPYRAAKAGVRLLTETIAAENHSAVRANAVMPSVIDTPANREMLPDADHDSWVDPDAIARVVLSLCSDATPPTNGAAVPVYGDA
ncbi:SDR family oxidoreductase [Halobacterium salinarum]|uniref:SDR family oxidoreductase n=1 Tax=Halobacterium salinarum TaxID=2242 RepID=UPI0025531275|nr:SDR family oxidoreductase [Halobacterium salinarum]MDL0125632.1 SDR family oxidoreductase [Halobacterium salinarum]